MFAVASALRLWSKFCSIFPYFVRFRTKESILISSVLFSDFHNPASIFPQSTSVLHDSPASWTVEVRLKKQHLRILIEMAESEKSKTSVANFVLQLLAIGLAVLFGVYTALTYPLSKGSLQHAQIANQLTLLSFGMSGGNVSLSV